MITIHRGFLEEHQILNWWFINLWIPYYEELKHTQFFIWFVNDLCAVWNIWIRRRSKYFCGHDADAWSRLEFRIYYFIDQVHVGGVVFSYVSTLKQTNHQRGYKNFKRNESLATEIENYELWQYMVDSALIF